MSKFPALETERLQLIQISSEHSEALFEIFRLDEVTRYYGMSSFTSVEQAAKLIESFQKNFLENRAVRWGMVSKATGEFIGTVGLNNLQRWSKRAEIGYDAHPAFWRGGYTSEAVRELLRYSFEELDLHRLAAITYPQNTASFKLLEKLGFQQEGILRGYLYQNEKSHDAAVYSLLRPDWEGDVYDR